MTSVVYMTDLAASWTSSISSKISELFERLAPGGMFTPRDLIAVKLHFGEAGNTSYIKPQFVRPIIRRLHELKTRPFLTDTNTLYVGSRGEAYSHLLTAFDNGFTREIVTAPVIIADGLRGNNMVSVPVNKHHFSVAHIAADISNADGLVVVSHFKGHELGGFGGAIKNLGMGCAARVGKLEQHSNVSPKVKGKKCVGCGQCLSWCQGNAINLVERDVEMKAYIDPELCIGCAECIAICPEQAIQIRWNETAPIFMEKMVEYASSVASMKRDKIAYVTFVTDVTPCCDCNPFSDAPIVPDIGILASHDPIAIDQAAVDLVNNAQGNQDSKLQSAGPPGEDKFRDLYPEIDWAHQLVYGEEIGLGSRAYSLERI